MKVIISGGGTGGHIFPALAIADAIKALRPDTQFLFVGANGRMEMEKVPAAGYTIKGLDVVGFQRSLSLKNLAFPFKLAKSMWQAYSLVKEFKPDIAIGVGGYASGPTLKMATWLGIPIMIQEQNSYAGVTNKLLAKKAENVFVAYEGMEKFFDANKIIYSGNPVRSAIVNNEQNRASSRLKLGLNITKKTVLIFGGSLGAKTINLAIASKAEMLRQYPDIQIIWQVGKLYYNEMKASEVAQLPNVTVMPFIEDMVSAYTAADLIVSRAGALTISELCVVKKPAILVPSPNVAEDHQTHNAMALVNRNAALLVKDDQANAELVATMLKTLEDESLCESLAQHIGTMAKVDASQTIAQRVIDFVTHKSAKV